MRLLHRAVLFAALIGISADAAAPDTAALQRLIGQAVEAGRSEARTADANAPTADERRIAQRQFSRLLLHAGDCVSLAPFVAQHPELKGSEVEALMIEAIMLGDTACARTMSPALLAGWDDPLASPGTRIGYRFKAGAVLAAEGNPAGIETRDRAEAELLWGNDRAALWDARAFGLLFFTTEPQKAAYLEYLAGRIKDEHPSVRERGVITILAAFTAAGRCDLVKAVLNNGPRSCDGPRRDIAAPEQTASQALAMEAINNTLPLDESGLKQALAIPRPAERLMLLIWFVDACRAAMAR
jgi:hypothetical protein